MTRTANLIILKCFRQQVKLSWSWWTIFKWWPEKWIRDNIYVFICSCWTRLTRTVNWTKKALFFLSHCLWAEKASFFQFVHCSWCSFGMRVNTPSRADFETLLCFSVCAGDVFVLGSGSLMLRGDWLLDANRSSVMTDSHFITINKTPI